MKKPSELTNRDIGVEIYHKNSESKNKVIFIGKYNDKCYKYVVIFNCDDSRINGVSKNDFDDIFTLEKPKEKPIVDWSTISPWFKYVAMDRNDIWFMFKTAPTINNNFWKNYDCIHDSYLRIPDEYAPKFDGYWKDSLVERPN